MTTEEIIASLYGVRLALTGESCSVDTAKDILDQLVEDLRSEHG